MSVRAVPELKVGEAGRWSNFSAKLCPCFPASQYAKFDQNIICGSRVMSIITKISRPCLAKFDQNIPCDSRVMSIITKRPRLAGLMLGEASSPFCIPVVRLSSNV